MSSRPLDLYLCTSVWILFYSFRYWQKFTPTAVGTGTWLNYQYTPLRNIHTLFTLREAFTKVRIFFEVCHYNLEQKTSSEDLQSHWRVKVKAPWRSTPHEGQWRIFRLVMSLSSLLLWLRFKEYSFDDFRGGGGESGTWQSTSGEVRMSIDFAHALGAMLFQQCIYQDSLSRCLQT